MQPLQQLLGAIPNCELTLLDSGCCGLAGLFGYENYEVSRAIGERRLLPAARSLGNDEVLVSPGFSCRQQVQNTSPLYRPIPRCLCSPICSDNSQLSCRSAAVHESCPRDSSMRIIDFAELVDRRVCSILTPAGQRRLAQCARISSTNAKYGRMPVKSWSRVPLLFRRTPHGTAKPKSEKEIAFPRSGPAKPPASSDRILRFRTCTDRPPLSRLYCGGRARRDTHTHKDPGSAGCAAHRNADTAAAAHRDARACQPCALYRSSSGRPIASA